MTTKQAKLERKDNSQPCMLTMNAPFVSSSFGAVTITVEAAVAVATAVLLMTVALYRGKKIQKKATTTKKFKGMVSNSFNIQYQRTGIDSLSSLDEIELKQNVRGLF